MITRNRTPSKYVYYGLHLYFSGLSLRKASERLSRLYKRNHVLLAKKWNWIQKYKPQKLQSTRSKVLEYIVDETMLKVGSELIWLWVAIEPENKQILALSISKERNMFVAERFIQGLVKMYGKHPISTDGGTWYPMASRFLHLDHHIHSYYEKSIIERTMQYIKDRTECFDDYFPCRIKNCKLKHVRNWLRFFVDYHNKGMKPVK
jgi:putative transposase